MDKNKKLRNPKQKRSRERVELILKATQGVLENDGIKALSTNSIAARAGIPVSSIYQYFPNKEAILAGLYEDYLQGIRDSFEASDTQENRDLPWQEFYTRFLAELNKLETRNNIDIELDKALGLYPVLLEIDQRHGEWVAGRMADSFKQFGSRWPRAKLMRLAHYLYDLNSAAWTYRSRSEPPKKEALEWSTTAFLAVAGQCFE